MLLAAPRILDSFVGEGGKFPINLRFEPESVVRDIEIFFDEMQDDKVSKPYIFIDCGPVGDKESSIFTMQDKCSLCREPHTQQPPRMACGGQRTLNVRPMLKLRGKRKKHMIQLYCGPSGAGKSYNIAKEIKELVREKDNRIMLIGDRRDVEDIIDADGKLPENVAYASEVGEQVILDFARVTNKQRIENPDVIAFLFIDAGPIFCTSKPEMLEALNTADTAGVRIVVAVQTFDEVARVSKDFLENSCYHYTITKHHAPRLASKECRIWHA